MLPVSLTRSKFFTDISCLRLVRVQKSNARLHIRVDVVNKYQVVTRPGKSNKQSQVYTFSVIDLSINTGTMIDLSQKMVNVL